MTTVFFLLSILYAWIAWNLFNPNFHHQKWSFLSFVFGLPAGELGLHLIFWQAITVAFFVMIGAVWGLGKPLLARKFPTTALVLQR